MKFRERKLKGGYSKTIKYKVSFKPLLKLLVDMNMPICTLYNTNILAHPSSFFAGEIDAPSLNNLCNFLGVPPHEIFEVEIYDTKGLP